MTERLVNISSNTILTYYKNSFEVKETSKYSKNSDTCSACPASYSVLLLKMGIRVILFSEKLDYSSAYRTVEPT